MRNDIADSDAVFSLRVRSPQPLCLPPPEARPEACERILLGMSSDPPQTPPSVHSGTSAVSGFSTSPSGIAHEFAERYSRQILFPGIGAEGQACLARAHAAIIGVGATGAATAQLLARAGVGRLTLIDRDFVEPSNLQRQVLFDEADARDALPKAEAARRKLAAINSSCQVTAHVADLVPANIHGLLSGVDLLLDGTDNFETRYLLNDFAISTGTPWIYAAAVGACAATMNILPARFGDHHTACLACLFPAAPTGPVETCDTAGILSTAVNLAASLQTTEALKCLTGQPQLMRRTLLSFDLWTGDRSEINTSAPRRDCDVCAARNFRYLAGTARPHITLCGRNSVQIHEHHRPLDLPTLAARLAPLGDVRANGMLLRFTHGVHTLTVFPDGRALIHGTTDPGLARSLYARFIGS
jgi:molybdopterin/thiamine biosynthesis adenylyltransferase